MLVTISPLAPVTQIEIKDKKIERSKVGKKVNKGALHFNPNSTKEITKDEFDYIRKNEKEFFKFISEVIGGGSVKPVKDEEPVQTETEEIKKPSKKNKSRG